MIEPTRIFEVCTFMENLYCDKCDIVMKNTGDVFSTNPPQYKYECPRCKRSINSKRKYPEITYAKFTE